MRRVDQFVLIGSAVGLAWLAMMAVHEAGHVLGALLTGGSVKVVVLHPLGISCTVLSHNPHPLLVTWAGPVLGVLIPLAAFGVAAALRMPGAYLLRFFAGFCSMVCQSSKTNGMSKVLAYAARIATPRSAGTSQREATRRRAADQRTCPSTP